MIGIIDGYTGEPNIYADDIGEYNISVFGEQDCVLPVGNKLAYTLVSNNEIKIKDGIFLTQGRRGLIKRNTTETARIENGSQGMKRHDLIVIEYSKENATTKEKHSLKVIKGTPAAQAEDPAVRTGNIRNGDSIHQMPLYRVVIDGLNVTKVEKMFDLFDKPLRTMVNDCFQSVSDGKKLVASAITGKRVPTDAAATFAQMAENIKKIVLGSGNAVAADVLQGKTFTNNDGVQYTGTMPNKGAVSAALNAGGSYVIPAGYHNGSGRVTANSLASQTGATATAANISKGKTAWVNGSKITGTGPTNFRAGELASNYAISGLTKGKTYIVSMAALENELVAYISSGGSELRKVHAFSNDKYSGMKTFIVTIMFTATAGTVTFSNVTLWDRNAWTLVEI